MGIGWILLLQSLVTCASLDIRADAISQKEDNGLKTAVVIRTCGKLSEKQSLISLYARQLQGTKYQLSVLHVDDGKQSFQNMTAMLVDASGDTQHVENEHWNFKANKFGSSTAQTEVPVCMVSQADVAQYYMGYNLKATVKRVTTHSAHDQFLAVWYRHCNPSDATFVWFVESDARFTGQVTDFFDYYSKERADLVSTGFRIAGPSWWKYKAIPQRMLERMGTLSRSSSVVKNLHDLPSLRDGNCNDIWSETKDQVEPDDDGVLFFQDHVLRASNKLLAALHTSLSADIAGPSESWIAHVCASQLTFSEGSRCEILDFAPVMDRTLMNQWVSSEHWCWDTHFSPSGQEEACSPENRHKWFHKVESEPDYFDCK